MIEDDMEALFVAADYRCLLSVVEIDGPGRVEVAAREQAGGENAIGRSSMMPIL